MPPFARRPKCPSKGFSIGPPSSKTSENVQKDNASTRPSHCLMVFAKAGPTKVVSRDSFIPCTFHSVQNSGRFGVDDTLISVRTLLTARQTRSRSEERRVGKECRS